MLIESGIDCEFNFDAPRGGSEVGKLINVDTQLLRPYTLGNNNVEMGRFKTCQPRMNHKHAWDGGECPLPEGFIAIVYWRNDKYMPCQVMSNEVTWDTDGGHSDIIAFQVLGLTDGYVMPWEGE